MWYSSKCWYCKNKCCDIQVNEDILGRSSCYIQVNVDIVSTSFCDIRVNIDIVRTNIVIFKCVDM